MIQTQKSKEVFKGIKLIAETSKQIPQLLKDCKKTEADFA